MPYLPGQRRERVAYSWRLPEILRWPSCQAALDLPPQTVEIDARPAWGLYPVTFVVRQNPRQGMRSWFWVMDAGERLQGPT